MDEEDGDAILATNAPAAWPLVRAPAPMGGDADAYVANVAARVRDTLRSAGYRVDSGRPAVALGRQRVRVDLVVHANGADVPVFVFPGDDPHRDAVMYGFLRAALSEAGVFGADPVYYAPDVLPDMSHPKLEEIVSLADRFLLRVGLPGAGHALPPDGVVALLRANAGTSVEGGGGEAVQEAAAYVGEWVRRRCEAVWLLREDLQRTVLAVRNVGGTVQFYLPLFAWMPDAVRTGYDGLAEILESVVADTSDHDADGLAVRPAAFGPDTEQWLADALAGGVPTEHAIVLRRCAACGRIASLPAPFSTPAGDVGETLRRSLLLAQVQADQCPCGSHDYRGAHVGYLLPLAEGPVTAVVTLVYSTESHTRIAVSLLAPEPPNPSAMDATLN